MDNSLKDAVYDWVNSVSPEDVPVIWADGDDAGYKVYVALRASKDKAQPNPDVTCVGGVETITEVVEYTLVVNCYGNGAEPLAQRLRSSVYASARFGYEALWGMCGLGGVTDVLNLSALEIGRIEGRYEFRVTLHATVSESFGYDGADTIGVRVDEFDKSTVAEIDDVDNTMRK